jgi:hypothetical protein
MPPSHKLLDFIRGEFEAEERLSFARTKLIPDSRVAEKLQYYLSLLKTEQAGFADYLAHAAHNHYAFVVGAQNFELPSHPFAHIEKRWLDARALTAPDWNSVRSVPLLRAMVRTYKIDRHRGTQSCVTKEQFKRASSINSVKAPELRKRLRATLKPFGHYETDALGYYQCKLKGREFSVGADFGGRYAQLRYVVVHKEFKKVHPLFQFRFEQILGFGRGDWDFIVEENVDEVFALLGDLVRYCFELPGRMRLAVK